MFPTLFRGLRLGGLPAMARRFGSSVGEEAAKAATSNASAHGTLAEMIEEEQRKMAQVAEDPCFVRVDMHCESTTPNDVRRLFSNKEIPLDRSAVSCEFTDDLKPTGRWLVSVENEEAARKCHEALSTPEKPKLWQRFTRRPVLEEIPREEFEELREQQDRPELAELDGRGVVVHNLPEDADESTIREHFEELEPEDVSVVEVEGSEGSEQCAVVRFKSPMHRYQAKRKYGSMEDGTPLDITVVP